MKRLSAFLVLFFSTFSLFSFSFPEIQQPAQFVEAGTGYCESKGIEGAYVPLNLMYGIHNKDDAWAAKAATQFSGEVFDLTLTGDYCFPFASWQLTKARINLGAGLIYHLQRYNDLYLEQDGYFESMFRLDYKWYRLVTRLGYGFKAAAVDALMEDCGTLWDGSFSLNVQMEFKTPLGLDFYYEIGSHTLYRYPLFESTHHIYGTAWNFKNGVRIAADIETRFRDQYSNAPYMDFFAINLHCRYSF